MITRQVPWDRLDRLVPDDLDEYWQIALDFLKIHAPALARDPGSRNWNAIEAAERRDKLIEAEAKRLDEQRRAGDRRRFHRLDAGDRQAARHHRQAAARRGGAARPRHGSRRRLLGADRRRRRRHDARRRAGGRPRAIRHARAARPHRHHTRRRAATRAAAAAWPRAARLGSLAARRHHRTLAGAHRHERFCCRHRRRARLARCDRSRQCRGRGAGHRGRLARNARNRGQVRRAGHARPRAGAPRRRRAGALAGEGGRFRRRQSRRHIVRRVRAAGRAMPPSAAWSR